MFGKIRSLLGARSEQEFTAPEPTIETIIRPDQSFFAIGDIHGCADKLEKLLLQINTEADPKETIIFLGDAVDRGPDSAATLKTLMTLATGVDREVVVLMGNHERMMLDFIDDPSGRGARWLVNGGIETLESFGIKGVPPRPDAEDALDYADELEAAMPEGMQDWIRALPLHWQSGNVHCVHAGMNPEKSPDAQSERSLIWGHQNFLRHPRTDGICVVHGHTITAEPTICDGRIAVDTGAYRGKPLTAAHITSEGCRFIQAD